MKIPSVVLPILLALLSACTASDQSDATQNAVTVRDATRLLPVTIRTATGDRVLHVEVARTDPEQARGLMFRSSLPDDGGMLFPFDTPRPAAFWMKDTDIPLDMLFVRADGSIARIAAETVPQSLDTVESGEPVIAVLEIGGGRAAALGIVEGDKATWPDGPR